MVVNIEIKTNYNIGEMVYVISEVPVYNNSYSDKTKWIIKTRDWDNRKITSFEIAERIITQRKDGIHILYRINNSLYKESDIFKNVNLALEECNRRNK